MKDRNLRVSLSGHHVGELVKAPSGQVHWAADKAWEAGGQMPRLGVQFLDPSREESRLPGLPSWFENLLPDSESPLRRRLCKLYDLRDRQSYALLQALGHDLVGAVEVSSTTAEEMEAPASDAGGREGSSEEVASRRVKGGFSPLAGMQLKFSMSMVNERLSLPAKRSGVQWIVKLPGKDYPELPEVEQATMSWASAAAFEVPAHFTTEVARLDGVPDGWAEEAVSCFAVQRFDRGVDGRKIHQEDLCQAFNLAPEDKYGGHAWNFDRALQFVADVCGEDAAREMARRMGFVIASGNNDAHLKNWSLLWGDELKPTLTPCYDLIATVAWPRFGWTRTNEPELALRVGRERSFRRLEPSTLSAVAKRSGQSWAAEEIMAGVVRARDSWRQIEELAPPIMRAALETHWQGVPILRAAGPRPL